jgi:WD40 repeat protein
VSNKMYWSVAIEETSGLISLGTYDGVVEFGTYDAQALRFEKIDVAESDGEPGGQRLVSSLAFDAQNHRLLVARWDGTLTEWDIQPSHKGSTAIRSPAPVQVWRAHGQKINRIRGLPEERRALTAAADRVIVWDFNAAASVAFSLRPMNGREVRTAISKSGQYVLSWNEDNRVVVYARDRSAALSYRNAVAHGRIVAGAISDDGERIALGTEFGEVEMHALSTGHVWTNIEDAQRAQVETLAFHPKDHNIVFAGLLDQSAVRLKVSSTTLQTTLVDRFSAAVSALALNADRLLLAAAPTSVGPIRIFDVDRLSRAAPEIAYNGAEAIRGLSFNHSGQWLALASSSGVVRLVNLEKNQAWPLNFRKGDEMRAVAFSADDKLLAGVGDSNTIALWTVPQTNYAWQIPLAAIRRLDLVEFGPGSKVLTTDDFGNVTWWAADPLRWRETGLRILRQEEVTVCD